MSVEPDVATRRKILEAKLQDHQAKGYEHSVNAKISEDLGEPVTESAEHSRKHYQAARKIQQLLSELPSEDANQENVSELKAAG